MSPSFGAVGVGADEDLSHSVEDDQAPATPVAETARTRQKQVQSGTVVVSV